jgi:hypothetical protein
MRLKFICGVASMCFAVATASPVFGQAPDAKKVLLLVANADALAAFDPALKLRLEWQHGAEVTVASSNALDAAAMDELALQHDMVLISETVGSTSVLTPDLVFNLQDTPVPVISFEAYMWEDAFWTELPQFGKFGNTGRPPDLIDEPLADGLGAVQTDIFITAAGAQHPMSGGFAEGAVTVHTIDYSVNFGTPSADATVIATADAAGKWPTHYVYDEGDKLVDGSTVPATRIAAFIGQAANPNANFAPQPEFFSDEGFALIDAMFEYTLGPMPTPGDVNLDGNIDAADFESIRDVFLTEAATPEDMTRADVNHDLKVDFADFGLWKVNSQAVGQAASAAPEPDSALLLAAVAVVAFCGTRQRRNLVHVI